MTHKNKQTTILMADDDLDDRLLVKEALEECPRSTQLVCVEDGQELIDYLRQDGKYHTKARLPYPSLILLDLNMPRKNGVEALLEIKTDPQLKHIPVVIFTTSNAKRDISVSYSYGANSYFCKPTTFANLVRMLQTLQHYWFETATLLPQKIEQSVKLNSQ